MRKLNKKLKKEKKGRTSSSSNIKKEKEIKVAKIFFGGFFS